STSTRRAGRLRRRGGRGGVVDDEPWRSPSWGCSCSSACSRSAIRSPAPRAATCVGVNPLLPSVGPFPDVWLPAESGLLTRLCAAVVYPHAARALAASLGLSRKRRNHDDLHR